MRIAVCLPQVPFEHGGAELFAELDPATAYGKCPMLKAMLDDMLMLAKAAGLKK